jgi:hypothetical protein
MLEMGSVRYLRAGAASSSGRDDCRRTTMKTDHPSTSDVSAEPGWDPSINPGDVGVADATRATPSVSSVVNGNKVQPRRWDAALCRAPTRARRETRELSCTSR